MGAALKSVSEPDRRRRARGGQSWMLAMGTGRGGGGCGSGVSLRRGAACWALDAGCTGKIRAVESIVFGLGIRALARAGSSHALGLKSSPARRSQNQLDGTVLGACGGTGGRAKVTVRVSRLPTRS